MTVTLEPEVVRIADAAGVERRYQVKTWDLVAAYLFELTRGDSGSSHAVRVSLRGRVGCTCKDYQCRRRAEGETCKHITWALAQVEKLERYKSHRRPTP
jgi:hypothetical protein